MVRVEELHFRVPVFRREDGLVCFILSSYGQREDRIRYERELHAKVNGMSVEQATVEWDRDHLQRFLEVWKVLPLENPQGRFYVHCADCHVIWDFEPPKSYGNKFFQVNQHANLMILEQLRKLGYNLNVGVCDECDAMIHPASRYQPQP